MIFGRKKPPRLTREQSLRAKPVRLVEGDAAPTDDGGAKLKVPVKPARWAGWFMKVPEGTTKTFELDAIGLTVWNAIDGKTSVARLIRLLAKRYNLSEREAEVSITRFLQTLTTKGLIGMPVARDQKKEKRQEKQKHQD